MSLRNLLSRYRQPLVAVAALAGLNALMLLAPWHPVSGMAGALYLFVLPGLLIPRVLGWKFTSGWEWVVHTVGLSIAWGLLVGLLVNSIGGTLHWARVLKFTNVLYISDALMALLIALIARRKPPAASARLHFRRPKSWWLMHACLAVFPLLAVAATTLMNNNGGNGLVLALLGGIVVYVVWLVVRANRLPESMLPASLYAIGLALLLMTSLRSWHITGYDINQEFQVFQLTKHALFWSMAYLQDPYNACLSITILPTITGQFTHVADEYIFKLLFQVLFGLMPVLIYLVARRFSNRSISFLAGFFFIAQIWFFQGMPTLVRQEFGLFFFGMVLLTLFTASLSRLTRYQLAMLYGIAMVVSHYSTTYIALALLLMVYAVNFVVSTGWLVRRYKMITRRHFTHGIPLLFLLFLFCAVVTWNAAVTNTSGAFAQFVDNSAANINKVFSGTTLTDGISQVLYTGPADVDFHEYTAAQSEEFRASFPQLTYYEDGPAADKLIQPTEFHEVPARLGDKTKGLSGLAFRLVKTIVNNLFILIGLLYFWYSWRRKWFKSSEFIWMGASGFVLLALLLVIPDALKEYNLERLYFQLLLVWALVGVYGGLLLTRFIKRTHLRYVVLAGIYCVQLLFYSGFVFNFTGGPALIATNNYGEDYEKFYTHEAEVSAARWLGERRGDSYVFTNGPGRNKLWAYGNVDAKKIMTNTMPSEIGQNAYVFQTYMNTAGGRALYVYKGTERPYTYPQQFVDDHKDQIYSSGVARVYR